MSRQVLPESRLHEGIRSKVSSFNTELVDAVEAACAANETVVVGMEYNPHCRRARKALEGVGVAFEYLEYGGYTSQWKPRLALKMWAGWPTFPMVFHKGVLIGGANELEQFLASGGHKA